METAHVIPQGLIVLVQDHSIQSTKVTKGTIGKGKKQDQ